MHRCPESDRTNPDNDRESDAREVLGAHLEGTLIIWDDNSEHLMWDYCLVGGDRSHLASVEVTRSIDQALKEFYIHRDIAGAVWDTSAALKTCWTVILDMDTNPLKVDRSLLDHLLEETQALGLGRVTSDSLRPLRDIAGEIGLKGAWERDACGEVPKLHIDTLSVSWTGPDQVSASFYYALRQNAEKLNAAPPPRQLLVWIEVEDLGATFEMTKSPTDVAVELPDYVDVAWVACGSGRQENTALWRATNGEPWSVLVTMQ